MTWIGARMIWIGSHDLIGGDRFPVRMACHVRTSLPVTISTPDRLLASTWDRGYRKLGAIARWSPLARAQWCVCRAR